jgi:hypothetical protein
VPIRPNRRFGATAAGKPVPEAHQSRSEFPCRLTRASRMFITTVEILF